MHDATSWCIQDRKDEQLSHTIRIEPEYTHKKMDCILYSMRAVTLPCKERSRSFKEVNAILCHFETLNSAVIEMVGLRDEVVTVTIR
jgi:hypothetical protein